ncbi:hypothetical protein HK100_010971 [Physocladia obscura]|uniref:Major facilitator superfamily (MFS) profile domain-containing protein n=1 Tax=Physocladia obscura TaxID=109957 RepID=A0AAD5XGZ0_9FUNG|nr:hypothetical protein HK100_010971 [Physocladia obscura]
MADEIAVNTAEFTAQALDPKAPKLHSKAMRKNWLCIVFALIALASNAYDVSLSWNLPLLTSFNNDVAGATLYSLAVLQTASNVGQFLAPFFYVPIFDGIGRRQGVLFGTFFAFIGVCVQVFGTFGDQAQRKTNFRVGFRLTPFSVAFSVGRVINQFGIAIAGAVANIVSDSIPWNCV